MKVSEISLVSFGRVKKGKKVHADKYTQSSRTERRNDRQKAVTPPPYLDSTPAKTKLDMEKILSLEVNESDVISKPASFEETHMLFPLDKYQQQAIDDWKDGKTTIVSAPTGTGKTLIAEYAIKDALDNNKKIIYLSPQKALSNEKYSEFARLFGEYDDEGNLVNTNNLGLMTGDVVINPEAPVLVMTTEIYRNSLLNADKGFSDIDFSNCDGVIYDEFHYLGNKQRGTVWEESVMNTPKNMKQMMLSATASNAQEIQNWVQGLNKDIETSLIAVPESERHVPLKEYIALPNPQGMYTILETKSKKIIPDTLKNPKMLSDRQNEMFNELQNIIGTKSRQETVEYLNSLKEGGDSSLSANYLAKQLKMKNVPPEKADAISLILADGDNAKYAQYIVPKQFDDADLSKVAGALNKNKMTPALFYVFSKKGCDEKFADVSSKSKSLLTPEESKRVYDEVQKAKASGVYLGSDFDQEQLEGLMKGYAVHHAGKLPAYKSLIENLARQGLVKVCFATDTLILGINMPFKTAVFTSLKKFDGEKIGYIKADAFKQGAGRAGRRGKDDIGNVVVLPKSQKDYEKYVELTSTNDTSIKSRYDISYASLLSDSMLNNADGVSKKSLFAYQNGAAVIDSIQPKTELMQEYGLIEENGGYFERTEKGEIAKNVFGVNEIFLTELLYSDYFEDMDTNGLIALCAALSDEKDIEPQQTLTDEYEYLNSQLEKPFSLLNSIDVHEIEQGIKLDMTPYSTSLVPGILDFANAPNDRESSIAAWQGTVAKIREKGAPIHEGDLLRIVNGSVDILKMIAELSPKEETRAKAQEAIQMLRKPPVVDIFNYELGNSANNCIE